MSDPTAARAVNSEVPWLVRRPVAASLVAIPEGRGTRPERRKLRRGYVVSVSVKSGTLSSSARFPGQGELRASRRSWAIGRQIGYGFLAWFRLGYEDRKPGLSPARRPARNAGYGSRRDVSDPKGYPPRRHDKRIHEIVMGRAQATNRNEVSAHMLAFYRASSTFLISRDISRDSSLVWR